MAKKVRRPSKVRIGCFTYSITFIKCLSSDDHGTTNTESKEIMIYDTGNEEVVKETLCHEIDHILFEDIVSTINDDDKEADKEEKIIRLHSPRMKQCFTDNPK